jgi:hypothetical protein
MLAGGECSDGSVDRHKVLTVPRWAPRGTFGRLHRLHAPAVGSGATDGTFVRHDGIAAHPGRSVGRPRRAGTIATRPWHSMMPFRNTIGLRR